MKSPAFQFYPADWLSDMRLRLLPWGSKGVYIDLLCYCWREGWIPADSSAIAQLCGCHDVAIIQPCLDLFIPHESDPTKLVHKRLIEERNKQIERKNERSNSGLKGAKTRWGKGLGGDDSSANGSANGSAKKQLMAKNGSSSSSSSSKFSRPSLSDVEEYAATLVPPFTGSGKFFDYYESNGWKVGKNSMKSWQAAVRKWHRDQPPVSRPVFESTPARAFD